MEPTDNTYMKAMGSMERPIPGSSLTNDPENPLPFERPPRFVKRKEALEHIFVQMTKPDTYPKLIEGLANGVPVTAVAQTVLMKGFMDGKWNPDMFINLMEPTMYMTMALAERVGVDYRIDGDNESAKEGVQDSELGKKVDAIRKSVESNKPSENQLPKDIQNKIENLKTDPLIKKPDAAPLSNRGRIQDSDFSNQSLITKPKE